ncbi:unnamed protein product [Arctogadus glacialis]
MSNNPPFGSVAGFKPPYPAERRAPRPLLTGPWWTNPLRSPAVPHNRRSYQRPPAGCCAFVCDAVESVSPNLKALYQDGPQDERKPTTTSPPGLVFLDGLGVASFPRYLITEAGGSSRMNRRTRIIPDGLVAVGRD